MPAPGPEDQDRLPLPGPRALWWVIGVLALALPASLVISSMIAEQGEAARPRSVEFAVRTQTLIWRTTDWFGSVTNRRPARTPGEAVPLPRDASATANWPMRQGAIDTAAATRELFEEAVAADAVGRPPATRRRGATQVRSAAELVVAFAVATRQDTVAVELGRRLPAPSADVRAALAGLPEPVTPTGLAMPAAEAAKTAHERTFGPGWSSYLRDRVRARVYLAAGEQRPARELTMRLHQQDGRIAAFFAALVQLLGIAGLFGTAMLLATAVRGGLHAARDQPAFTWLRERYAGLDTLTVYRRDALVPLLGFAAWLAGYFAAGLITAALPGARAAPGFSTLLQACAGILVAHAVIHAFARVEQPLQQAARLGGDAPFWTASTAALRAYCMLLPVMVVLVVLTSAFTSGDGEMHPVVGFLLDDADPLQIVTLGLAAIVAAPVGEELMFRGFLYRNIRQRFGISRALWSTALLFALLHAAPYAMVPYVTLGLAFGLVYEWTGSLWASIVLHALWNSVVFAGAMAIAMS